METDLAGTLVSLMLDINRSLRKQLLRKKCTSEVNMLQIHALSLLGESKGMIMKEFANAMFIAAPSATVFVQRLVKLGWAKRLVDNKNRKIVRIIITPAGKRILVKKQKEASNLMRQLIHNAIPTEEQQHFLRILTQLLAEIRTSMPHVS